MTALTKVEVYTPVDIRKTSGARNNNFNFLRLLFAALVLVAHAPELRYGDRRHELLTRAFGSISFGELAVNGFFLLSGYLIIASWVRDPSLRAFADKRVRRIVPGFLVAFLVSVLVLGPLGATNLATYFTSLNYPLLARLAMQLRPPEVSDIFVGRPYPVLNSAMWSIAYEFRCYAIVAVLGLLGSDRQRIIWPALFLATAGLLLVPDLVGKVKFPGSWQLIGDPVFFVRLFTFFSAGACFRLFQSVIRLKEKWAALATLAVLIALFYPPVVNLVLATAGAYALFWLVFVQIPSLAIFQRLDDVSYGLYLYGWPIQKLLDWYFPTTSLWLLAPVAFIICSTLGYASWRLVESPWLQRPQRALATHKA